MTIIISVSILAHGEGLALPAYQSLGAAGADLLAATDPALVLTIEPGDRKLIPTGLSMELPSGYEAQIRPRSGLALKHGITVLNSPGTIDSDYRGEIGVLLINHGKESFQIRRGDRIAQIVFAPVIQAQLKIVSQLAATQRDQAGFGSTGLTTGPSRA
jgi:dUTP pyrophosphatase